MTNQYLKIIETFCELQDMQTVYEKKARTYGDINGQYTPAEAFLLRYVHDNQLLSITKIAKTMYKSKSAISQMMKKIETKGLIIAKRNAVDQRSLDIEITDKGEAFYHAHKAVNLEYSVQLSEYLHSFSADDIKLIMKFLSSYSQFRIATSL